MSDARGGALARMTRAWRALTPDGRLAAAAALGLFVTMLLPWYQLQGRGIDTSVTAFGAFSFVEAAVLLVALGVLALLFARTEQATFYLPGGDGGVVMGAGLWAALLLVWRLFDKPDADDALVGVEWGIFFALGAAGVLAYAGSRMRRAQLPPAPLVRERRHRPASPPPAPGTTVTRVLPPERPQDPPPSRRRPRARPATFDDQLTIPLGDDAGAHGDGGGDGD